MDQLAILEHLKTNKITKIIIPLKDGGDLRTDCVCKLLDEKNLEAKFLPGNLNIDEIKIEETCIISLDVGGPILAARVEISEILQEDLLKLQLHDLQVFDQRRNFFRAYTNLTLQITYTDPDGNFSNIRVENEFINISGNGINFPISQEIQVDTDVKLEIQLPDKNIRCSGVVVRFEEKTPDKFNCAVQYTDISDGDQQQLIKICNEIQREEMSQRIMVKNELDW